MNSSVDRMPTKLMNPNMFSNMSKFILRGVIETKTRECLGKIIEINHKQVLNKSI